MRRLSGSLVAIALIYLCFAASTSAKPAALDFKPCTSPPPGDLLISSVLVLDLREDPPLAHFLDAQSARLQLATVLNRCPIVDTGEANTFLDSLKDVPSKTRLIATKDDSILVFAFHQGELAEVKVDEVARKKKIVEDFGDLIKLIKQVRAMPGVGAEDAVIAVGQARYVLRHRLATVTFSLVPADDSDEPADTKGKTLAEAVTGGAEHFRLSANLPVNTIRELDYDTDTGQPTVREAPREFMAGIDWYAGDVLTDFRFLSTEARQRLGVKALFEVSKSPLDAVGLVAAFRGNGFSIFAGPIWNREAREDDPATQVVESGDLGYKVNWRVGVGFDLGAGLKWLTSAASDAEEKGEPEPE